MKILQVVPYSEIGGTEKAAALLSCGLAAKGHKVTVLCPEGPGRKLFAGLELELLPQSFLQRRRLIRMLAPAYDLIHIHAARELVAAYQKPVVFTPHSYYNRLDQLMVGVFAKKASVICFTRWEEQLLQDLGLRKTAVIPNGIGDAILPAERNEGFPLKIGYMGRLAKDKGLDLLLGELAKVKEPYQLLIAGVGKEEEKLQAIAKELGIPAVFLGIQEPAAFLSSIDIFVLPSRTETFGLALVEAMSAGLCCVAADVCGLKEILGDAGITVPHDELAQALEKLLQDRGLRESLGKKARERFLSCYTEERMISDTEKFYVSLLNW